MSIGEKIKFLIVGLLLLFLSGSNSTYAQWTQGLTNTGVFGLPDASASDILVNLAKWLLGVFFVCGVVGFIIAGIMYLVSTGNDEVITKAKKYMLYSIVGVVVGLSGVVIIQAVDAMLKGSSMFF